MIDANPNESIWMRGLARMRPFVAAAPWISLLIVFVLFILLGGTLAIAPGIACDLPQGDAYDALETDLTAIVIPLPGEHKEGSLIFFDDARYVFADESSQGTFLRNVEKSVSQKRASSITLFADRNLPSGELIRVMELLRAAGIKRVQVAEKKD